MFGRYRRCRAHGRDFGLQANNRRFFMPSSRRLAITATTGTPGLVGCAQTSVGHDAHHPGVAAAVGMSPMPMGGAGASVAGMDEQLKTLQAMHNKMTHMKARQQRSAVMAEHMKVMHNSMAMMGGRVGKIGMDGMKDKPAMAGSMQGMPGKVSMSVGMAAPAPMMDKRMQTMQSMKRLMMDPMPQAPGKP